MSKLLNNILDKISEDNNGYRNILRELNKQIEERTSAFVGDVVTASNYTLDFSDLITRATDALTNPISRIIESYVIKDLRGVETVNEQFVDKINDKLENAKLNTKEEKQIFSSNLNTLLNDKYLEIVKIKRVDFTNPSGVNDDIEKTIEDFTSYVKETVKIEDDKFIQVVDDYKSDLYYMIHTSLGQISDLYLNNFVNEVSSSLAGTIDLNEDFKDEEEMVPYIPEMSNLPEIELPKEDIQTNSLTEENISDKEANEMNVDNSYSFESEEKKEEPVYEYTSSNDNELENQSITAAPLDIPPIKPIEINEEPLREAKRQYDVEEILKIAKSPIVSGNSNLDNGMYKSVEPIKKEEDKDSLISEFDEKEIVEEMILRLTKRLESITERQKKYNEEKEKLESDEAFINDLINSSNAKKEELDNFESELNNKEKELNEKQKELDKKINDVLPFANAIMNQE